MNEEEIIRQHFAKIGSKGGKAGTGESKRRNGSESNLKKYWEDVKAGRREPPKHRGRPRKTSKQLADAQPDSPTEAVKQEKPTVQKQTGKRTVSSKNGELRPWRPAEEIIREGREAAEKARKEKEKKVSYKPQTFASEMAQAVAEGDFEKVMKLRSGWKRTEPKVGPNSPCPCGSGKKFKKCCGA